MSTTDKPSRRRMPEELATLRDEVATLRGEVAALKRTTSRMPLPTELPEGAEIPEQWAALLDFMHRYDEGRAPADAVRERLTMQAVAAERDSRAREAQTEARQRQEAGMLLGLTQCIERGYTPADRTHAWLARNGVHEFTHARAGSTPPSAPQDYVPTGPELHEGRALYGRHASSYKHGEGVPSLVHGDGKHVRLDADGSVHLSLGGGFVSDGGRGGIDADRLFYEVQGMRSGQALDDDAQEFLSAYLRGELTAPQVKHGRRVTTAPAPVRVGP